MPSAAEELHIQRLEVGGEEPLDHIALIARKHLQYRAIEEDSQLDAFPLFEIEWGYLDSGVLLICQIVSQARFLKVDLDSRRLNRKGHESFFAGVRSAAHLQAKLNGAPGLHFQVKFHTVAPNFRQRQIYVCLYVDQLMRSKASG